MKSTQLFLTCVVADNVLAKSKAWNRKSLWFLVPVLCHIEVQWWWKRWIYFHWFFSGSERWTARVWCQILFFGTSSLKIHVCIVSCFLKLALRGTAHFWAHIIGVHLSNKSYACNKQAGVTNFYCATFGQFTPLHKPSRQQLQGCPSWIEWNGAP